MPKRVLFDEIHLSIRVQSGLADQQCRVIRQTLRQRQMLHDLRDAVRQVFRRKTALRDVHITVSR